MKKQPLLALGLIVAISLFLFSYISTDADDHTEASLPYSQSPVSLEALQVDGSTLNLTDYKGKIILLDFWATWCPPCVAEIPHFIELQNEYADDIQIIGVSVDKDRDVLNSFISEKGINYPIVYFSNDMTEEFGSISSIPTTFILDKDLKIVDKGVGFHDKDYFEKHIHALLK